MYSQGAVLLSEAGGVQGDPKIPGVFAALFRRSLLAAREAGDRPAARSLIEMLEAFLDDAWIAGHAHAVIRALIFLDQHGERWGFKFRWDKFELVFPAGPAAEAAGVGAAVGVACLDDGQRLAVGAADGPAGLEVLERHIGVAGGDVEGVVGGAAEELLSAGGSGAPTAMLAKVGIDIADPAFWKNGLSVISKQIDDFGNLLN